MYKIDTLVLSATKDKLGMALHTLRDYISRFGHQAGLSQRAIYNLKLAIDEVVTNIITHGYKGAVNEPLITVTTHLDNDKLEIILEDSGVPFDPREYNHEYDFDNPLETRELGGLGIYFALSSVDKYEYTYVDSCNRNTFIMARPLEAQALLAERILLFDVEDDSPDNIYHQLQNLHYDVYSLDDRYDVFDAIQNDDFDVMVIGDEILHEDATWLLKHIKRLPQTPPSPILVASSDSSFIIRCLELGATDYVHVPVAANFLSWRLDKILEQSTSRIRKHVSKLSQHIKQILLSDDADIRFGREFDLEHYLETFLIEIQGIYNADAGTVYLRTNNDSLRFAVVRTDSLGLRYGGTSNNDIAFPTLPLYDRHTGEANHHSVATHVTLTGETINIPNIYENEDFDFSSTRWFDNHNQYRSISTLTVPLKDHDDYIIGVVQLINAQDEIGRVIPFDLSQQMLVEALCAHTAVLLSNRRLLQQEALNASLRKDLEIGRQIQRDFMPKDIPEPLGWQIEARFHPAREVAGDFYDIFELDDLVMLIIADVCDKGVGAALFMALIRSLVRAFISQSREIILAMPPHHRRHNVYEREIKRVIDSTNDYILEHHYELNMFGTLFAGVLNTRSGKFTYINAGHTPAPMVCRGSEIIELPPTGPAVGMFDDADFRVEDITLMPDDLLVATTDGIADVQNSRGEQLGIEPLKELICERRWERPVDIIHQLEDVILNFKSDTPQYDDLTYWFVYREPQTEEEIVTE